MEKAIEADKRGPEELVWFSSGGLGPQIRNALLANGEGELKIGGLISCVHNELFGPMDKDWVVQESLSVACYLGVKYTTASARTAAYLKGIEVVRSGKFDREKVIEADVPVPFSDVYVRRVEIRGGNVEFIVLDESINKAFEVALTPFLGATEDDFWKAVGQLDIGEIKKMMKSAFFVSIKIILEGHGSWFDCWDGSVLEFQDSHKIRHTEASFDQVRWA